MATAGSTRELQWVGWFAVMLAAAGLGAWRFGHAITLGVTADEMKYVPDHNAAWTSEHIQLVAGADKSMHLAIGFFLVATFAAFLVYRSTIAGKTRVSPIGMGLILLVGTGGGLLLGLSN